MHMNTFTSAPAILGNMIQCNLIIALELAFFFVVATLEIRPAFIEFLSGGALLRAVNIKVLLRVAALCSCAL